MTDRETYELSLDSISVDMTVLATCESDDVLDVECKSVDFNLNKRFEVDADLEFTLSIDLATQNANLVFESRIEVRSLTCETYKLTLEDFELESESVEDESTLAEEIERLRSSNLAVLFKFEP